MRVLLIEPDYYSRYPPLGLLKLASMHRSFGNDIKLTRGVSEESGYDPDKILITSLFTYAWKPVHKAIEYYHQLYPDAEITVGGIYASLMPDRLKEFFPFIKVHIGLFERAERYIPAYDILKDTEKWKNWNSSIFFTSRGCIRNCPFCVVPKMEGKIRSVISDLKPYIYPGHKKIILWDNNFLASPDWKNILNSLNEINLKVDFNQGLDVRLIDKEKAALLADLNFDILRMAYDNINQKKYVHNAVKLFVDNGIKKRKILFYSLYNFYSPELQIGDTPSSFFEIIKDIANLGCVSYPMRYEPLDSLTKNSFISPFWQANKLESIAEARRVIGINGGFPPYQGLVDKFNDAVDFKKAFELRPVSKRSQERITYKKSEICA